MHDFRLNDAVVRPRLNEILIDGRNEKLPAKFIDVLMVLAERQGEVFCKDELLKRVWNDPLIGDDSLANAVWMLRKTLGDDAKRPEFIETVPRRGYRLIASVAPLPGAASEEVAVERAADPAPPETEVAAAVVAPRRSRRYVIAALALLAVLLAVGLWRGVATRAIPLGGPGATTFAYRTSGDITEITRVAPGTVLVAENGGPLYAFDTARGTERWRFTNGDAVLLPLEAVDGRLYVGSEDGYVYALDLASGRELWRHAAGAALQSVPLVRDGQLIYGDIKGNVRALASADAKPTWQVKFDKRIAGPVLAAPELAVVRVLDGTVAALDRGTGAIRWQRHFEGSLSDLVESAPNQLLLASDAGFVTALDSRDGTTQWQAELPAPAMVPLVAGERVFALGRYGDLVALSRTDGKLVWRTRLDVADLFDLVWWSDRLVVVLEGGALGVVDPADGRLERSLLLDEAPDGVESDGARLLVATQSGRVLGIDRSAMDGLPAGRLLLDARAHWTPQRDAGPGRYAIEPMRAGVKLPELAWRLPVVGDVQDVAVGDDGTVYLGDERSAMAISAEGAVLWRTPMPRATCTEFALDDGAVYFGRRDHVVYALDRATGKQRWTYTTGDMVIAPPTLASGRLLIGSDDHKLHVLDASDGKPLWSFATQRLVRGAATIAGGMAIFGSADRHVYAIDFDSGKERWKFESSDWIVAHPVVANDRIFVGAGDGDFHALALATGRELWRVRTAAAIWYRPAVDADTVYFGSGDGHIYAVDQATGTERWRYRTGAAAEGSVVLADGVLYAGSHDAHLYAIEAKTGKPLWKLRAGGSVFNPKLAHGALYVASADQHLYALRL